MIEDTFRFPFEKLDVWQMAVDLAQQILRYLEKTTKKEHIRLISQMEAAATSPAQNIAEGRGRHYKKKFIQFLYIAEGSLFEVVTLNEIFRRSNIFSDKQASDIREKGEQIDRKLNGLIKSLKRKDI